MTWFGEFYAMVTIHWGVRFRSLPELMEFDVSYLVQLTERDAEDHLFISHEDEQETMARLGLLNRRTDSGLVPQRTMR